MLLYCFMVVYKGSVTDVRGICGGSRGWTREHTCMHHNDNITVMMPYLATSVSFSPIGDRVQPYGL